MRCLHCAHTSRAAQQRKVFCRWDPPKMMPSAVISSSCSRSVKGAVFLPSCSCTHRPTFGPQVLLAALTRMWAHIVSVCVWTSMSMWGLLYHAVLVGSDWLDWVPEKEGNRDMLYTGDQDWCSNEWAELPAWKTPLALWCDNKWHWWKKWQHTA